jgi:hypothetical protein
VAINFYVPDVPLDGPVPVVSLKAAGTELCLDAAGSATAEPRLRPCTRYSFDELVAGRANQRWTHTSLGYLQSAFYIGNKELACLRVNRLAMGDCQGSQVMSARWQSVAEKGEGLMRLELHRPDAAHGARGAQSLQGMCLTRRIDMGDPSGITLAKCSGTSRQLWRFSHVDGAEEGAGTISDPAVSQCFDNMQRSSGPVGYYGCHSGSTQRWKIEDGKIQSTDSTRPCIGLQPAVSQFICAADDADSQWRHDSDGTFRPVADPDMCLTRGDPDTLTVQQCQHRPGEDAAQTQRWSLESTPSDIT